MERMGEDWQEDKLKSHTAIRCAKAALLLSSIRDAARNSTTNLPHFQIMHFLYRHSSAVEICDSNYAFMNEEKIEKLKIELVKEKQKLKKLKYWIGVLVLYYFLIVAIYPVILNSL